MRRETTIRTSSGSLRRGELVREKRWQPSGSDLVGFVATFGASAAAWPSNRTTVKDKHNRYHTGRRVR